METPGDPNPSPHYDFSYSETPDLTVSDRPTPLCTTVPNRIYVGGINYKVSQDDLWHIFSQYGEVTEVNIVCNEAGVSKGYGFVTFVSPEEALKVLSITNSICVKGRWLGIAQAVQRRQRVRGFSRWPMTSHGPDTPQASGAVCAYPSAASQHSTPLARALPPQAVFPHPADYYHQMPVLCPFHYEYSYQAVHQYPGPVMEPSTAMDFYLPPHFHRRLKNRRRPPHKIHPTYPGPHSSESDPAPPQTPNPTASGPAAPDP